MQTLLVTDQPHHWHFANQFTQVVSAIDYISKEAYFNEKSIRVINLCKTYHYKSIGFYVSLLAEARGHKITPSLLSVQDINKCLLPTFEDGDMINEINSALKSIKSSTFTLSIYFEKNLAKKYNRLCQLIMQRCPLPLLRVTFKQGKKWKVQKLESISIKDVPESHKTFLTETAQNYFCKKRYRKRISKQYFFDLAILYNPHEKNSPSNEKAIQKFIQAGDKIGLNVETIDKDDMRFIAEYDALFIRETTAFDHYTYQFSRRAHAEGLIVLDDPISILRCSNKVFLYELLYKNKILQPKSYLISKHNWKEAVFNIPTPCVLKRPDSAFSHGVIKIKDEFELRSQLPVFLKESQLVLAQEFIPTDFDWRIIVLDNVPILACRYYMAKGHWQIYNWQANQNEVEGDHDCVPLEAVPKSVINMALKACKLINNGLYGVDIKQSGNKIYCIEINDNPNLDHGVEDSLLGDKLYEMIMHYFMKELKHSHGYK